MKLYVSIVDFQLHLPKTLSNAKMVYILNVEFDEWNNIAIHDFFIRDHLGFQNRYVAMNSLKSQNSVEQYVSHCGYLVRDQIPISASEWREKRGAPEISFVSNRDKELVWKAVADVFTFDTNDEELKVRIYDWTIKKMAVLF